MARLRKFSAYQKVERPYTRFSKYKKHNFIKARPNCRIVRFDMGDVNKDYDFEVHLIAKKDIQIRDNAIEAARQSSNRILEQRIGKKQYHYKLRLYPHHILRENPLAAGAGADRMSTGMKHAFGKPIGIAVQAKKGKVLATIMCKKAHLPVARIALKRAANKLPCGCSVIEKNLKAKPKAKVQKAVEEVKPEAVEA